MKFPSLLLCIKPPKNPILTPMRSMGKTSENPSVYAGFQRRSHRSPTIILQITLLVSVNSRRLYRRIFFLSMQIGRRKRATTSKAIALIE